MSAGFARVQQLHLSCVQLVLLTPALFDTRQSSEHHVAAARLADPTCLLQIKTAFPQPRTDISHMSADILIESYEPGHSVASFCVAALEVAALREAATTSRRVRAPIHRQVSLAQTRGAVCICRDDAAVLCGKEPLACRCRAAAVPQLSSAWSAHVEESPCASSSAMNLCACMHVCMHARMYVCMYEIFMVVCIKVWPQCESVSCEVSL